MSEEAKRTPGFGARIVSTTIAIGGGLMLVLAMYFGMTDTVPMTISAEMAKSAGCPHLPPARFGTTWWDYVFALRGLSVGGECRELSAGWLIAEGREWLWISSGASLLIGAAMWNQQRGFAIACAGAGIGIGTAAVWISLGV